MTEPRFFLTAEEARARGLGTARRIIIALASIIVIAVTIIPPAYALVAWAVFG